MYNRFYIEDVAPDNACFFRACANQFNFRWPDGDNYYENALYNTDPTEVIGDYNWGYYGDKQTILAKVFLRCANDDA